MSTSTPSRKNLTRSTGANFLGSIAPLVLQVVTIPLYLHIIGADRYGMLSLVWLLLGFFGFFELGFGKAIASRIASLHNGSDAQRAAVFWTGTLLSICTGMLGGLILLPISWYLFAHTNFFHVPPALRNEALYSTPLLALILPVATSISALSGALQGRQSFVRLNLAQTAGMMLYQIAPLIVGAWLSVKLPALIAAAIVGRLSTAGLLFAMCLRDVPITWKPAPSRSEIRPLLGLGGWISVTSFVSPILNMFDRFAIGNVLNTTAVAMYAIPFNVVIRFNVIPGSFQSALFPRYAMTDEQESMRLLGNSVRMTAWIMAPIVTCGILLIKPFLLLWLHHDQQTIAITAGPIGQILFLGLWFSTLATTPFFYLQSRGRPDVPAKCNIAELIFYVPALYILMGRFGLDGAAMAWALRAALDALLLLWALGALRLLRAALGSLAWGLVAFAWARYGRIDIYYWIGTATFATACIIWTLRTIPPEAMDRLPLGLRRWLPAQGKARHV